jgi:acyl carrier protein
VVGEARTDGHVTLEQVVEAIRSVAGAKREIPGAVRSDTVLEELGLSSLEVAEVIVALEERIGGELDTDSAADAVTVGDLVRLKRL